MKSKLILAVIGAIAITALTHSFLTAQPTKKMAFFDYNKAYNDCTLKKDLESDLERVVSSRKSELDSMQLELTLMSGRIKNGSSNDEELVQFQDLKNRYLTFQSRYEDENLRLKEEYFTQIRTHINEKSQEFAESKEYDYFFSATGDGSLMYAKEANDVTKDFIQFIDK